MLKRGIDPCSVDECDALVYSKGWCQTHYNRNYHHGSPHAKTPKELQAAESRKSKPCKVEGCIVVGPLKKDFYCEMHYWRLRVHGDVNHVPHSKRSTPEERFWSKVEKADDPDGCWLWTGRTSNKGRGGLYGSLSIAGKTTATHRFSYELANDITLTSATPVHHICGTTLCVNPKHLQAITPQENTAEMLERQFYLKRIAHLEAEVERLQFELDKKQTKREA